MSEAQARHTRENPFEKVDHRGELQALEQSIEELRIQYEQFFSGLIPLCPDKLHNDVKRRIRKLLKAPFKNSEFSFRLKTMEGKYHTLHSYWQRVLRQREDGTYVKDVFKANLREKNAFEEQRAQTAEGAAARSLQTLFRAYKDAVEKQTGKSQNLDYDAFERALIQRGRDFKNRNEGKKVSFSIVVKDGKVNIQAKAKE